MKKIIFSFNMYISNYNLANDSEHNIIVTLNGIYKRYKAVYINHLNIKCAIKYTMVYYTAITLKLNTKPWKKITSKENYMQQLHWICNKFGCQLKGSIAWELDNCCQLHTHTTLQSTKALFRKKICAEYRKQFKDHNIWLVPDYDPKNWEEYCSKSPDEEEKYHWLCRYYQMDYPDEYNNEKAIREGTGHILDDIIINKQNHWEKVTAEFID